MTNKLIVEKFYTAFARKDFETMNNCYSDDVVFSDPVFGFLQGDEVKAMWQMLCTRAKDFKLTFNEIVEVDEEFITCKWVASYSYGVRQRKVVNKAKAFMKIIDGKITEHSDGFRLSTWMAQAFGLRGKLFGWTNFMKRKVHKQVRKNLRLFMNQ